jgi:hypothetical protein
MTDKTLPPLVQANRVLLPPPGPGLSGGVGPAVRGLCRTAAAGKPAVGERSLIGDYSFEPWWVSCSHWGMYPWPNVVGIFV